MLAALALSVCACGANRRSPDSPDSPDLGESFVMREVSPLSVEKGKITDASGSEVVLRGVSTHGIAWFPQYVNANAFRSVKEAGGNAVRVAMYTDTDGGYLADPEGNTLLVRQAIEDAKAMDMYVIVDWHILSDGDPNDHLSEALTFFDAVASEYADCPNVIYEICNEPNGVGWDRIKTYAYAIVPVIRQYAPDALVIVGTPEYSDDLSAAMNDPLPMEGLLYAYHYYAGEKLSARELELAAEKDFPVIVSEWGIGCGRDGEPALEDGKRFIELMDRLGVSRCAWSLCNKDEVYSILKPECEKLGGFGEEDLSETGKIVWESLGGGL